MTRRRGSTLFELVVVLVIIGVVAEVAITNYAAMNNRQARQAMEARVKVNASSLRIQLEAYYDAFEIYPRGRERAGRYFVGPFENPFERSKPLPDRLVEPSNRTVPGSLIYVPADDQCSYVIYGIGAKGDTIITLKNDRRIGNSGLLFDRFPQCT